MAQLISGETLHVWSQLLSESPPLHYNVFSHERHVYYIRTNPY